MSICGRLFVNLSALGIGGEPQYLHQGGAGDAIGLITKHGILIVEFANNLQNKACPSAKPSKRRPESGSAQS
jgi:hypothetical protein